MILVEILFVICLFLTLYSYFIYPVIIAFWGRLLKNSWEKGEAYPNVTIIISAYNEEKDIEAKVKNSLELDYPSDKLEIIVSSDGSTDKTNEIVAGIKDERLILREFTGRIGKTACLNKVIPDASGQIIIFTDANSIFQPDMLLHLTKNFKDPEIGSVSGWTRYCNPDSGEETTGIYARLEKKTKLAESAVSSCVGADGAIFAIRKDLYVPLGANDINDFIIPLNVVKKGKRVVLDKDVFCMEETTQGVKNIYNRQVRITTRTAWALRRHRGLLNVSSYGSFAFFLLSHKVIRLLTPFFFLLTFVLNLAVLFQSPLYIVTMVGQLTFIFAGLMALFNFASGSLFSICKYFLITFSAQFIGCLRMAIGIEDVIWTPKR